MSASQVTNLFLIRRTVYPKISLKSPWKLSRLLLFCSQQHGKEWIAAVLRATLHMAKLFFPVLLIPSEEVTVITAIASWHSSPSFCFLDQRSLIVFLYRAVLQASHWPCCWTQDLAGGAVWTVLWLLSGS